MDEIIHFRAPAEFRKWLAANHRQVEGIWLRIFKKDSEEASVTYAEALDEALCFDGSTVKSSDTTNRRGCRSSRHGAAVAVGPKSIRSTPKG